jgi:hypothetical protein
MSSKIHQIRANLPFCQEVWKNPHSQNETAKMAGKISHLPKWQCAKSHGVRNRTVCEIARNGLIRPQRPHSAPTASFGSAMWRVDPGTRLDPCTSLTASFGPNGLIRPFLLATNPNDLLN